MDSNTKGLYAASIPDLQSMNQDSAKAVKNNFRTEGADPLVNQSDRKTGQVSKGASNGLQAYGSTSTH